MSQSVIAKRYAKGLFQLAEQQQATEAVQQSLEEVVESLTSSADFQRVLEDTRITMATKGSILKALLDQMNPHPLVHTFIRYLLQKRRLLLLDTIGHTFSQFVREKLGVLEANVIVTEGLSDSLCETIKQRLAAYSGKPSVQLQVSVDPSILGGMVTRIGSTVIDGSLRSQLNRLTYSIGKGKST